MKQALIDAKIHFKVACLIFVNTVKCQTVDRKQNTKFKPKTEFARFLTYCKTK